MNFKIILFKKMDTYNYKTEIIEDVSSKFEFFRKVVILGENNVGKTALLNQLINKSFTEEYKSTKGYEFKIMLIKVNETVIKMQIWDMCGSESYRPSLFNLSRNAQLAILVYSISSRQSFDILKDWIPKLREQSSQKPIIKIILIGNKNDDEDKREVSFEDGKQLYEEFNLEHFEEINAVNEIKSPNFMEIGAICLYKDYDNSNNNDCTISYILDAKDIDQPKKQKCC